jgi:hypothetical protein
MDATAFNYDSTATCADPNSCIAYVFGCTDPAAANYNSDPNVINTPGSCVYPGCTDMTACNYDSGATIDDLSCILPDGCTDATASNYDSNATCDDGSCIACVDGCMDATASNYDSNATCDDGSCIACVDGCTDATASNYDSNATCDDGSCIAAPAVCLDRPTGLHASGITDTKFRLNWDNMNTTSCMVLKYHVRFRETGTTTWTTRSAGHGNGLCNFGLQNTDKLMVDLLPSTTYDIRLRVQYCHGQDNVVGTLDSFPNNPMPYPNVNPWSAWTPSIQVTMADPCPGLTNVAVQTFNGQPNKAKFTWDSTGTYVFARIYTRLDLNDAAGNALPSAPWSINGGFGIYSPTLHHNEFSFTPGEYYRVQMAAFCSDVMTSYKSGLTPPVLWGQPSANSIKIEGGTAIGNLDVYPNPSRDIFNVTFTSEEIQNLGVRIINIVGEVIYTEDLEQFVGEYNKQVDLATYTKGVYFLEIITNDGVVNKKLILQ